MPRGKKKSLPNAESFMRHNISVWREAGYPDWQIGKVLMRPRLSTPKEFAYWGLRWSQPPSLSIVLDPKDAKDKRLGHVLDQAIAGSLPVSRSCLCRRAGLGSDTFKNLCIEFPALYEKWEQLKELNRARGAHEPRRIQFLQLSKARAEKLDEAFLLLDKAIEDGTPTSLTKLSLGIGRSRNWLQMICHEGYSSALRLRQRLADHNAQVKQSA